MPLVNVMQDTAGSTVAADGVMLRVDVEGLCVLGEGALVPGLGPHVVVMEHQRW